MPAPSLAWIRAGQARHTKPVVGDGCYPPGIRLSGLIRRRSVASRAGPAPAESCIADHQVRPSAYSPLAMAIPHRICVLGGGLLRSQLAAIIKEPARKAATVRQIFFFRIFIAPGPFRCRTERVRRGHARHRITVRPMADRAVRPRQNRLTRAVLLSLSLN